MFCNKVVVVAFVAIVGVTCFPELTSIAAGNDTLNKVGAAIIPRIDYANQHHHSSESRVVIIHQVEMILFNAKYFGTGVIYNISGLDLVMIPNKNVNVQKNNCNNMLGYDFSLLSMNDFKSQTNHKIVQDISELYPINSLEDDQSNTAEIN